jgi:hypothetical protein
VCCLRANPRDEDQVRVSAVKTRKKGLSVEAEEQKLNAGQNRNARTISVIRMVRCIALGSISKPKVSDPKAKTQVECSTPMLCEKTEAIGEEAGPCLDSLY